MDYTFIVKLPQHLESAYKAGKIIITDGVARDVTTKQIVAHLEQVTPSINNVASFVTSGNPQSLISVVADIEANRKLSKVIGMIQQLQYLSYINLALTGINLGVSVAGFAIVISKLNQINKKLDIIDKRLEKIQNIIIKNETRKLLQKVSISIKDAVSLIENLDTTEVSDYIKLEVKKQLNAMEVMLDDLISRLDENEIINVSLPIIQTLYTTYANLIKAYLTRLYLSRQDIQSQSLQARKIFLQQTYQKLTTKNLLDYLYEDLLLKANNISESEFDIILSLYGYGCQQTVSQVSNHAEILSTIPIRKFRKWKKLNQETKEPLIWIPHS